MRRRLAVLGAAGALGLAGCGSSGDDATVSSTTGNATTGPAQTAFGRVLGGISDTSEGRASVSWGDSRRLRDLGERWQSVAAVGQDRLAQIADQLPAVTGLAPLQAGDSTSIGRAPRIAVRLAGEGVDRDAIVRKLKAAGARSRASTGEGPELIAVAPEGTALLKGPIGRLGVVNALDRVGLTSVAVAAGVYDDTVLALLRPRGAKLAAAPGMGAVASCLGDVVAAQAESADALDVRGAGLVRVGVGVTAPGAGARWTERICVAAKDKAAGDKLATRLRRATALRALEPRTQQPLRGLVRTSTVSRLDPTTVRVTFGARPERPAGLVFQFLSGGAVATWLGGRAGAPPPGSGP